VGPLGVELAEFEDVVQQNFYRRWDRNILVHKDDRHALTRLGLDVGLDPPAE